MMPPPAIAGRLIQEHLIREGSTILDIGCGPGNLSVALAEQHMQVTALDQSQGMIRVLKQKLDRLGDLPVHAMTGDWQALSDTPVHDTAIAAFFPEACSPGGIHHMETLAAKSCVLILGDGGETFALRRNIWNKVMPAPCPASGFHSVCAAGYLSAAGRSPSIIRLSIPAALEVDEPIVRTFYMAYFTMFGVRAKNLEAAIHEGVAPFLNQGRVCLRGNTRLVIVGWHPPCPRSPETGS